MLHGKSHEQDASLRVLCLVKLWSMGSAIATSSPALYQIDIEKID